MASLIESKSKNGSVRISNLADRSFRVDVYTPTHCHLSIVSQHSPTMEGLNDAITEYEWWSRELTTKASETVLFSTMFERLAGYRRQQPPV